MKFTPTNANVLIKIPPVSEKTKSGIIKDKATMEAEQLKPVRLKVIAVGSECKFVKAGDIIAINVGMVRHTAVDIELDGEYYSVFPESNIIGIYELDEADKLLEQYPTLVNTTSTVN